MLMATTVTQVKMLFFAVTFTAKKPYTLLPKLFTLKGKLLQICMPHFVKNNVLSFQLQNWRWIFLFVAFSLAPEKRFALVQAISQSGLQSWYVTLAVA